MNINCLSIQDMANLLYKMTRTHDIWRGGTRNPVYLDNVLRNVFFFNYFKHDKN